MHRRLAGAASGRSRSTLQCENAAVRRVSRPGLRASRTHFVHVPDGLLQRQSFQRCGILCPVSTDVLIVAGWVLVRATDTAAFLGASMPPRLLTISDCIQDELPRPAPWLGDWFQNRDEADAAARSLGDPSVMVVTVAMPRPEAEKFARGWAGEDAPWLALLRRAVPLPADAKVLGYEVLGAEEVLDFHSWHCHGYADEVRADLGVALTDHGLIPEVSAARSILSWMLARPRAQAPKPVPWTIACLAVDSHGL